EIRQAPTPSARRSLCPPAHSLRAICGNPPPPTWSGACTASSSRQPPPRAAELEPAELTEAICELTYPPLYSHPWRTRSRVPRRDSSRRPANWLSLDRTIYFRFVIEPSRRTLAY